jgi:hypothetical protein
MKKLLPQSRQESSAALIVRRLWSGELHHPSRRVSIADAGAAPRVASFVLRYTDRTSVKEFTV